MLSSDVIERLEDGRFRSAAYVMNAMNEPPTRPRPTPDEGLLVNALAGVFGNNGNLLGEMATIVGAAVSTLLPADVEQ